MKAKSFTQDASQLLPVCTLERHSKRELESLSFRILRLDTDLYINSLSPLSPCVSIQHMIPKYSIMTYLSVHSLLSQSSSLSSTTCSTTYRSLRGSNSACIPHTCCCLLSADVQRSPPFSSYPASSQSPVICAFSTDCFLLEPGKVALAHDVFSLFTSTSLFSLSICGCCFAHSVCPLITHSAHSKTPSATGRCGLESKVWNIISLCSIICFALTAFSNIIKALWE